MKLFNKTTLKEAIEKAYNNMDTSYIDADTDVLGTADLVYTDAIKKHKEKVKELEDNAKESNKLLKDFIDENQPESHKMPKTQSLKKMHLSESLFEDIDEDEELEDEKDEIVDLDDIDPFDLVMDTLVYSGRQIQVKDPETGKLSPRVYKGLYNYDQVGQDENDNITIRAEKEAIKQGVQFAKEYEIDYKIKPFKNGMYMLVLDPWTVNVEKLYPDRDKLANVGLNKKAGEKKSALKPLTEARLFGELRDFDPPEDIMDVWNKIVENNKIDALDRILDDLYPEGLNETIFIDILRQEKEDKWLFKMLNIKDDISDNDIEITEEDREKAISFIDKPEEEKGDNE